ncbi:MAG TPA: hypothetical protein VM537_15310 [Anaerolineae bacterium]|nr:hypothetical protein [Anaerolineae bacterium]
MYIIKREEREERGGPYSRENPEYRRRYGETQDNYRGVHPRDLSPLRRLAIKKIKLQGHRPDLVAEAAALRALMEEEINR